MSHCKVHNVRFYTPEPRGIRCMALNPSTKKLAVCRSDAGVEIWNLNNTWFLERTIPPIVDNYSIEDIIWCDNRLFSVGLHGLLVEHDLHKLSIKHRCAVTGEAAYCLDANKNNTEIAIGTEQGYLNIFRVQEDDISFKKFLDKQEGRIICLKFHPSEEFVVSGSLDALRVWNVRSGQAIHKMTTGRSEAGKPTIVWCLEVLTDFTVISGDSRGKVTFWDGKFGSQIESYQSHQADILSLCITENENTLYCAGVDPHITNYMKISIKGDTQKWVMSIKRKIHEHDVNCLAICEDKVYSGGADSYIACSYHPPKTLLKLPPILQSPCVEVASEARLVLLRYSKRIEIWSLGQSENVEHSYRGLVNLKKEPKKLLVLQRINKGYDNEDEQEGIFCSCISDNGKWIFYSTFLGIRLFKIILENDKPQLLKVDNLEYSKVPAIQAIFLADSSQLIIAPNNGGLLIYDLKDDRASVTQSVENLGLTDTVTYLKTTSCGKYLIVGDPSGNIDVLTLRKNQWSSFCKLPKYKHPPTALAVHPTTLNIVVIYSNYKIVEYSIKNKCLTKFSKELDKTMSLNWKSRSYTIRNIMFDPRSDNIIILHDDSNIIVFNKKQKIVSNSSKIAKMDTNKPIENGGVKPLEEVGFKTIKKYKHLAHLGWLGNDEMVAVEINPLALIAQLPPAYLHTTFGRK